jgi:HPr kinase/phosphorylase
MERRDEPTIHASAVLVGARAVLIRGAAGAGKSRLALRLIESIPTGSPPFARLIGDDRVHVEARNGRLLVRPAETLAGLIEVRGLGLRRLPFEPVAVVGLVVDLAVADAERLPQEPQVRATICGITLPRLAVAPEFDPLPLLRAALATPATTPIDD